MFELLFFGGVVLCWLVGACFMVRDLGTGAAIGRARFITHLLLTFIAAPVGVSALHELFPHWEEDPTSPLPNPIWFMTALGAVVVHIAMFTVSCARRLHDMNRSGEWALLLFVPVANLVLIVLLCCYRGSVGRNRMRDD